MKRLICTVGLPRCGKSTWAKRIAQEYGFTIVNPDAIQLELYGQRYWAPGEKLVWASADLIVRTLFTSGVETIVMDATNITRGQRDQWQSDNWTTLFYHVDTSIDVCQSRAIETNQEDLVEVIADMADRFEPLESDEVLYDD